MNKIMLVCNEGMSTSFLVNKMKEVAKAESLEVEIWAIPETNVEKEAVKADVILLGPQIAFMRDSIAERINNSVPVEAIKPMDFGRVNAKNVLDRALVLISDK